MRYLISYDIAAPRRRRRAAPRAFLLRHGERVRESVYEVDLRDGQWLRLCRQLDALIDPGGRSVAGLACLCQ